jgi:hypothetical protein
MGIQKVSDRFEAKLRRNWWLAISRVCEAQWTWVSVGCVISPPENNDCALSNRCESGQPHCDSDRN